MLRYRRFLLYAIVSATLSILFLRTWLLVPQKYERISYDQGDTNFFMIKKVSSDINRSDQSIKKILFWYEPYKPQGVRKNPHINAGIGQGPVGLELDSKVYRLAHCLALCDIFNRDRVINLDVLKTYDAVIFHQRGWSPYDVPIKRWPHQKFIFVSMESPAWRFADTESMANFFNWTMTYRQDSDIFNPYGSFVPVNDMVTGSFMNPQTLQRLLQEARLNSVNYASGKTKKIAWFVSNCKSLSARNEYVDRLKAFIGVDVYGQCGTLRCSRTTPELCRQMLE